MYFSINNFAWNNKFIYRNNWMFLPYKKDKIKQSFLKTFEKHQVPIKWIKNLL